MDITKKDDDLKVSENLELPNSNSEAKDRQLPNEYNMMINNFLDKNREFILNYYLNQEQGKSNEEEIQILLYLKAKRELITIEDNVKNLLQKKITEGAFSEKDKLLFENYVNQLTNRSDSLKRNLLSLIIGMNGEDNMNMNLSQRISQSQSQENNISNNLINFQTSLQSSILQRSHNPFEANDAGTFSELCQSKKEDSESRSYSHNKRGRNGRKITECPHVERKHYAKNMCYTCYQRKGRKKRAWECVHINKSHYAKGLCRNCYHALYKRSSVGLIEGQNEMEKKSL